ncbi:23263_t:CDS:1, partial [Gigaspora rosea]
QQKDTNDEENSRKRKWTTNIAPATNVFPNQQPAMKGHQRRRKRKWTTNILDINPNIN